MTQRDVSDLKISLAAQVVDNKITFGELVIYFVNEVMPIFFTSSLKYEPIKKWQILKLFKLSKAVYKFITSLKKL